MKQPKGLDRLPDHPGVYLMKDGGGRVIYVGKANRLRRRVRSYFQRHHESARLRALVSRIESVETVLVDSETEALILEQNLIKEHRPRYNVRLKDDKRYPFIKITVQERFPRVFATRRVEADGALYFGPYTDAKAMHRVLRLVHRIFPVRTCRHDPDRKGVRLCLDFQIGKCLGPCEGRIGEEEYGRMVEKIILLLKGKNDRLVKDLRAEMERAGAEKRYEAAAILRDQARAVERVTERQRITSTDRADRDVIALSSGEGEDVAVLLRIREGKMSGKEAFPIRSGAEEDPLGSFLKQVYAGGAGAPDEILCDREVEDREAIEAWLSAERGRSVRIHAPLRGEKRRLVDLARANAEHERESLLLRKLARKDRTYEALRVLQRVLELPVLPRRIECFDISNLGDRDLVGSSVSFRDGLPEKGRYRRYRIRTVEGIDDFASIGEIVGRRFLRMLADGDPLPDLVVVDGGKGQLGAALSAVRVLGVTDVTLVGLAKREEEVFREGVGDPLRLEAGPALYLLQRIRDEAHRFAITYQRRTRGKGVTRSALDTVPGLGADRKARLLERFRSIEGILRAGEEGIRTVPGIGPVLARRILDRLGGGSVR
ncbi:MAG: excinuclease ABC subunit UvrC [Candidatus Eisenbacteria bacterium]|nr:excinuclease ABC subunit UvrC [Candidatus Eisenbacteria bacterium]